MVSCLVIDEKVYAVKNMKRSVYYSPNEGKWGRKDQDSSSNLGIVSHCCINDKFLYACDSFGNIFWRKLDDLEWKKVKGLEDLRKLFPRSDAYYVGGIPSYDMLSRCYSKLINFGVNIVLVWFKYKKMDIWCAEISFERREVKCEVWGTV
ncbi:unnamed protein product [Arabis nemorensis]|uniref:FKB95-like N-terminal Kelch domain-containing protein n=1 Tax=Arabis nemorensis TaxID=586526 RepID=A0A565C8A7_9BRAS|nr:unnamed protein product [Arabis nemorensis]